ncbi:MAG: group 1 truncated hemoglobin [Gammaproteobacteria bacterium]|jgi:hemoglobin
MRRKEKLLDAVGGLPTLDKVHKIFYDKIYAHPWIGQFFIGHNQSSIEKRQTRFMAVKMGADIPYLGKEMKMAHRQMFITEEVFELRSQLLREALEEAGVPMALAKRWLKIDSAFGCQIVKKSIRSFYAWTWQYEKRVIIPRPKEMDLVVMHHINRGVGEN